MQISLAGQIFPNENQCPTKHEQGRIAHLHYHFLVLTTIAMQHVQLKKGRQKAEKTVGVGKKIRVLIHAP